MTGYLSAALTGDVNCQNEVNTLWLLPEERETKRQLLLRGLEKDGVAPSFSPPAKSVYFRVV